MNDTSFCVDTLSELFYENLLETEDFGKHLEHVGAVGPFIMREALIKNLHRFDDELKSKVPSSWRLTDRRSRTLITLTGEIRYKRRVYVDEFGCRRYLLDEILGITSYQRIESAAFLWIVHMAANISFEKTARAFERATGVKICRQTVMRCVHREGELLGDTGRQSSAVKISAPVLFMEFDGIWINLQSETKGEKKERITYKARYLKKSIEMKVGVIYAGKMNHKRLGAFHWVSDREAEDFFKEGMDVARACYDTEELDYLTVASDAASWCKRHGLDAEVARGTVVVSTLDTYHINQRVMRAFTKEADRAFFFDYLYSKDWEGFFEALDSRMDSEPHERIEQRSDLYAYIKNNLDWLDGPSLSRHMRERLILEMSAVFSDRAFYDHLVSLLTKRRYKRFLGDLERIVGSSAEDVHYDYACFLSDAQEALRLIRLYGGMGLGTMEGTNAKVYAARLKVWGCAWSRRGALAMMRVRAHIASSLQLIAPGYRGWLSDEERTRRECLHPSSSGDIPKSVGVGYEPPRGVIFPTLNAPPELYGYIRN